MNDTAKCAICGEPMLPGEEMFKFHGYSGNCPKPPLLKPPLPKPETEIEQLRKIASRYEWLIERVFCRGETTLAIYQEFGGAPIKGETIRQFMDRYIDDAIN